MKHLTFLAFLIIIAVTGCRHRELSHSCDSVEALGEKVLSAVESNDLKKLNELRINRDEFKKFLWPEFPASKNNVPFDFAWDNLNGKTIKGMTRALTDIGGQKFTLKEITFEKEDETYPGFVIHTSAVLHVTDENGHAKKLKFCGSVVERKGEFKFLSFRD